MRLWWWNWLELRNVCHPPVRTEPAEVPDTTLRQAQGERCLHRFLQRSSGLNLFTHLLTPNPAAVQQMPHQPGQHRH